MSAPGVTRLQVGLAAGTATADVAVAYVQERRHVVSTTMTYDQAYLRSAGAYALSPDLGLAGARHQVSGLPGAFADSAPDRWGRNLIARRLRSTWAADGSTRTVREVDYLLGVSDRTRQGALRFGLEPDGPYLDDGAAVPPLLALPRLLRAADRVDAGEPDDAAVKELLAAGSGSLGGARPKASVQDDVGLLIAKFPHRGDGWDVLAWEKTALDLAERCGIGSPGRRLVAVGHQRALLLERFDRRGAERVGYLSAMSLLGASDGETHDYLELAEAITEHGAKVAADLAQLWRRVAFMVVINNVDDHLRNHGFLRSPQGWALAPAFDLNPDPDPGARRMTTIGFDDGPGTALPGLLRSAAAFRLTPAAAQQVWDEVLAGTAAWRDVARSNGVDETEISRFAPVLDRFRR